VSSISFILAPDDEEQLPPLALFSWHHRLLHGA